MPIEYNEDCIDIIMPLKVKSGIHYTLHVLVVKLTAALNVCLATLVNALIRFTAFLAGRTRNGNVILQLDPRLQIKTFFASIICFVKVPKQSILDFIFNTRALMKFEACNMFYSTTTRPKTKLSYVHSHIPKLKALTVIYCWYLTLYIL